MARFLGVDYGTTRVGLALSDGLALTAQPLETVPAEAAIEAICSVANEHELDAIVVGLPTSLSGAEGPMARAAREFADRVESETGCTVVMHDERFTSIEAERVLLASGARRDDRRATRDRVAAAVMLQGFLDGRR